MRRRLATVVLAAAALAVSATASGGRTVLSTRTVVKAAYNAELKTKIVVDGAGRTVYMFTDDTQGVPTCARVAPSCPKLWPALTSAGKPLGGARHQRPPARHREGSRRQSPGHVQPPSALSLHLRPRARRRDRAGVLRPVVRALTQGDADPPGRTPLLNGRDRRARRTRPPAPAAASHRRLRPGPRLAQGGSLGGSRRYAFIAPPPRCRRTPDASRTWNGDGTKRWRRVARVD